MRRLIILAVLLGAMRLVLPLGSGGEGAETLLAFGLLVLGAYTVGEVATVAGLPRLVGYLVAGVVFGPSVLGTVTEAAVIRLGAVSRLAVALIAFLAGAELQWSEIRERGTVILKIMVAELGFAFVALIAFLYAVRGFLPFTHETPYIEIAFIVLFASIVIVHSPAVTMALLAETGARGPVARTTLGIVLVSDVVVVVMFSAAMALARALVEPATATPPSVAATVWEIGGALVVGGVLGVATALYLRVVRRELLLFAVLIAFLGAEIARLTQVEMMLTLLTAGFVTQNLSRDGVGEGEELRTAMTRAAAPVIVIFFALAGARIDLRGLVQLLPLVLPIAAVRAGAIWAGTALGARWAGASPNEQRYVWLGLVSQAGVAIAIVSIFAEAYPERGAELAALLLAVIAVNEMVGPILFRRALVASREVGNRRSGATEEAAMAPPPPGPSPA
jgi:Kef-type K+ transport system membrane component KefB